jgi:serine/threonine protein kinase
MMIGRTLSHFKITAKLGEGGMGEVYRAEDSQLGREVAIKVLPEKVASDPERLARFEREARMLAALDHSNIAAIYGLEEADGQKLLVMQLAEGETLAERIARGPIPVDEALPIALQIAEGLEAAHDKDIIHRDLKPANVKVTQDGQVKVLDFGLAKALEPAVASGPGDQPLVAQSPTLTAQMTEAGVLMGTAAYMSPEQARGQSVGKWTDIWAFGCLLYEMLTGQQTFQGDTVSDSLASVLHAEPDWSMLPAGLPQPALRLLRRCVVKDHRQRLQAIGDARIEISDALAFPPGDQESSERPTQRFSILGLVLGLVVAASAGLFVGLALKPHPPRPEPARLRQFTFSGSDSQPSTSPDGRLVAFTSARDGVSRIWIKQLAGGGEQPLTEGPDFLPRFSPDGSTVLFVRDEGVIHTAYRTALVGGQPRKLVENVSEAEWSPDQERIVFLRATGPLNTQLCIFDLASRRERILVEWESWGISGLRWSPDGSRIAVTRSTPQGGGVGWGMLLVDPKTGDVVEVDGVDPAASVSNSYWDRGGSSLTFAVAPNTIGDLAGAPSRVVRHDIRSGVSRTLFWAPGLFPFRGFSVAATTVAPLGEDRIVFDTFSQRELLREVSLDAPVDRAITRSTAADRQPSYSPDGNTVVFSSNRTGNLDLWTLDLPSRRLRQLTDDSAQDWDPGFTPDGRYILFSSDRSGNLEIWMADADGSNPRQVTQDGVDAENPTMTVDGQWIVYASGNPDHLGIFKIRPDGSDATQLVAGNFTNPEVSPDGRWALYVHSSGQSLHSQVRVVEIATGEEVPWRIEIRTDSLAPNVTYGRGRWLDGGSAIAFVGLDDHGRTGIYAQDFVPDEDTSATRRPLAGFYDDVRAESFGVSPDGSTITLAVILETRTLMLAEEVADW